MYEILREFLGRNFVSGLLTLKPKKPKNLKEIKPRFSPALISTGGSLLGIFSISVVASKIVTIHI